MHVYGVRTTRRHTWVSHLDRYDVQTNIHHALAFDDPVPIEFGLTLSLPVPFWYAQPLLDLGTNTGIMSRHSELRTKMLVRHCHYSVGS